jgi:hypothetical protein
MCVLIDATNSGDGNVIKNVSEKIIKYEELAAEI